MSTVEYNFEMNGVSVSRRVPSVSPASVPQNLAAASQAPAVSTKAVAKGLHRISEVRQQQGVSLRSVARKLNLPIQEVRLQEEPSSDLRVSDLLKWQEILEVPLTDLLIDTQGPLSEPVGKRASMLRVMKTAKAILESTKSKSAQRLSNMLIGQLIQIMPELADVSAWHTVGQRRTQDEVGRIVERPIPDSFFNDGSH
ncbi:MAG: helix-turn-helix transcriptional regulator [Planctomycetes bacterium]|nr:helix-turn-helix transcriptional regulator [Planctomycetota bacterium]